MKGGLPWLLLVLSACVQGIASTKAGSCSGNCGQGSSTHRGGGSSGATSTARRSSAATASGGTGGSASNASAASSGSTTASSGGAGSDADAGEEPDGGVCNVTEWAYCPMVAACPAALACASGSTDFGGQIVDLLACNAIGGATVGAIGADGVPIPGAATTTAADGTLSFCLPGDSAVSVEITAAGYPLTFGAEVVPGAASAVLDQLPLLSSTAIGFTQTVIPGGVNVNDAVIAVGIATTAACAIESGWSFQLSLPDGGAVPDGGYQIVYLGADGLPAPGATATPSGGGICFFYDIDPRISDFFVVTATNPGAGACESIDADFGLTGRIYAAGSAVSLEQFALGYHVPACFCPEIAVAPEVAGCPNGPAVSLQAIDSRPSGDGGCSGLGGASIAAIDANGAPIPGATATSAADGTFSLCQPDGPFSVELTAPGYPTTYSAELLGADAGAFATQIPTWPLSFSSLAASLPGGADPGQAILAVEVVQVGVGQYRCSPAGWTVALALADGGPIPDAGYRVVYTYPAYDPDPSATATSVWGFAYIYDVDPSLSSFYSVTFTNPGGDACPVIAGGFTGRAFVAGGALTVVPILVE